MPWWILYWILILHLYCQITRGHGLTYESQVDVEPQWKAGQSAPKFPMMWYLVGDPNGQGYPNHQNPFCTKEGRTGRTICSLMMGNRLCHQYLLNNQKRTHLPHICLASIVLAKWRWLEVYHEAIFDTSPWFEQMNLIDVSWTKLDREYVTICVYLTNSNDANLKLLRLVGVSLVSASRQQVWRCPGGRNEMWGHQWCT